MRRVAGTAVGVPRETQPGFYVCARCGVRKESKRRVNKGRICLDCLEVLFSPKKKRKK